MSIDVDKVLSYLEGFDIEGFDKDKLAKELKIDQYFPMMLWDYGYEIDEHLVILTKVEKFDDEIVQKIKDKISNFKKNRNTSSFNIGDVKIDIFNLVEDPLSSAIDTKICIKELVAELRKENKEFKTKQISIRSLIVNEIEEPEYIPINIESRVRSIEKEEEVKIGETGKKIILKSYVFAANLQSLLELYKVYGPDLFYKNVRNSIADELDVETSIRKTLDGKTDSKFWHLNNGISLFVKDDNLLDFSSYKSIKIKTDNDRKNAKELPVSIINGAQSITTSARYYKKTKDQTVLLRIYSFKKIEDESKSKQSEQYNNIVGKLIDEITIGLNRQKPIKADDLAYTNDFVKVINDNYDKNDPFSFEIIRRGAIGGKTSYSLLNFAKIVSAYLAGKPSASISKGAISFLKRDNENYFKEKDIFKQDLIVEDEQQQKKEIIKYYKPLNFAIQLKKYLDKNLKEIIKGTKEVEKIGLESPEIRALSEYGIYFVLALIIRLIAREKKIPLDDFSEWKYSAILLENDGAIIDKSGLDEFFDEKKIKEYVNRIIEVYVKESSESDHKNLKEYRSIMKNNQLFEKVDEQL